MEPQLFLAGALLMLVGGVTTLPAQLDLAPEAGVYFGEGTPFPCIRFKDGRSVARFVPPQGWRFAADGKRCNFHPEGVAQASGSFTAKPLPKDAEAASPDERLRHLLSARLPAEASTVEFSQAELPKVKLDRWEARHIQASYEHFGQKFRVALLVVPLEKEEFHIAFGSRAADFNRVFTPLLESLGTFTWNPTDEDPPGGKLPPQRRK
jgi:hypothetical protein